MAVPDRYGHNSAKHIQVATSFVIEQPLHATFVDQQWLLIVRSHVRGEVLLPHGGDLFIAMLVVDLSLVVGLRQLGVLLQIGAGLRRETSP